jgi:hypothetical protein
MTDTPWRKCKDLTEVEESIVMRTVCYSVAWRQRVFIRTIYGWHQFNRYVDRFSVIIWRVLEVHIFKVVVLTIFLCCISEVR